MCHRVALAALLAALTATALSFADPAKTAPPPGARMWDVAIAPALSTPAPQDALWGKGLPEKIAVATDVPQLLGLVASKEYIVGVIGAPDGPAWPEGPQSWRRGAPGAPWEAKGSPSARAVILPDQAALTDEDAKRLTAYVRAGGTVFAFGHASLLDPNGEARKDFLLADLFGARCAGRVEFEAEKNPVTFSCDSIFGKQYGPENVADGGEGFWASQDAPMPHWVQIVFPAPRQIRRVDVSNRAGFMLKDFDVQFKRGEEWVSIAAVRNNENSKVPCLFERPVETQALRLLVLKEMIGEKDRQIADVGEIEPYDQAGRKLFSAPYLIEARISDDAWAKACRSQRWTLRSPALRIQPSSAKPIAIFANPEGGPDLPLCTLNKVEKGNVYLFAIPEAAIFSEPSQLEALLRAFVGMPVVRHSGDEKFTVSLARADGGYLLRVADTDAERAAKSKDRRVYIKLNAAALGPISSAALAPGGQALPLTARNGWVQFFLPLAASAEVRLAR